MALCNYLPWGLIIEILECSGFYFHSLYFFIFSYFKCLWIYLVRGSPSNKDFCKLRFAVLISHIIVNELIILVCHGKFVHQKNLSKIKFLLFKTSQQSCWKPTPLIHRPTGERLKKKTPVEWLCIQRNNYIKEMSFNNLALTIAVWLHQKKTVTTAAFKVEKCKVFTTDKKKSLEFLQKLLSLVLAHSMIVTWETLLQV